MMAIGRALRCAQLPACVCRSSSPNPPHLLVTARLARSLSGRDGSRMASCGGSPRGRPAAAAPAAAAAAAAPAAEAPPGPGAPPKIVKRKVAMFLGYEGTAYRGLQIQPPAAAPAAGGSGGAGAPAPPPLADTVEAVLLCALFAAGGILESNMASLGKVGWSRSSRTDRGVHSLGTVVALKMEVPAGFEERDADGLALAAGLNARLPPGVRVFSVQRVAGSFSAREGCTAREYHYYLPLEMLDPPYNNNDTAPGGGALAAGGGGVASREDALAALRAAWAAFEGTHAFHNYTTRRLYRGGRGGGRAAGGGAGRRGGSRGGGGGAPAEDDEEEDDDGEDGAAAAAAEQRRAPAARPADGRAPLAWLAERDGADPVTQRHFRTVAAASVGDPAPPAPGAPPCVRLSVAGGSFMLHQIRHMVGAAVAVARGRLPLPLLRASLAAPARTVLPLAPASVLVLAGAEFAPWRPSFDGRPADAARWSGDALALRPPGAAARDAFAAARVLPEVGRLAAGPEWREWRDRVDAEWWDAGEAAAVLASHAAWADERAALRAARREARAAGEEWAAGGGAARVKGSAASL